MSYSATEYPAVQFLISLFLSFLFLIYNKNEKSSNAEFEHMIFAFRRLRSAKF